MTIRLALGFHRLLENMGHLGKIQPHHHRTCIVHHRRLRCVLTSRLSTTCLNDRNPPASRIGLIRAFVLSPPGQDVYNEDITRWFSVFGGLTCLANIYAVVAISIKSW